MSTGAILNETEAFEAARKRARRDAAAQVAAAGGNLADNAAVTAQVDHYLASYLAEVRQAEAGARLRRLFGGDRR
ncbi:hypothetical protein [Pseudonocardia sp. McavD-2-B]|uniref:hypothetical protein n=1 Tax=Pseudonocardia sp. McavD-2-B TaxID=2954499 RepID=UPI0020970E9C|nr:hypothetical protein [Pseudonocardia sp. McavD-2-B]MCO7195399.1 hypothetical protein [Pseudonocardia sp. McavD-2-B]